MKYKRDTEGRIKSSIRCSNPSPIQEPLRPAPANQLSCFDNNNPSSTKTESVSKASNVLALPDRQLSDSLDTDDV